MTFKQKLDSLYPSFAANTLVKREVSHNLTKHFLNMYLIKKKRPKFRFMYPFYDNSSKLHVSPIHVKMYKISLKKWMKSVLFWKLV